jgi:Na+-driven multidrug efflux pump
LNQTAIRIGGIILGGAGLLNLGLSFVSMKLGSILGIAVATVIAQSVASLVMSYHTCRLLRVNWKPWAAQTWLLPLAVIAVAAVLRLVFPPTDLLNFAIYVCASLFLLTVLAKALGIDRKMIMDEWGRIRTIFS